MHVDRDMLLRRANAIAMPRYGQRVGKRMLLDWVEDGLVPGPARRGRGRGPGAAWDWPPLAYRRVLQLCRLKQQGVTRRTAQLLALWFGTADFPIDRVRDALLAEYRLARDTALHTLPISWDPRVRLEPETQRQRSALARALGIGQPGAPPYSLDDILPSLGTMLTDQSFIGNESAFMDMMLSISGLQDAELRKQIIATSGGDSERDIRTLTGLLANPAENVWSADEAIAAANEAALVNARDFLRVYSWQQCVLYPAVIALLPLPFELNLSQLMQFSGRDDFRTRFTLFLHFLRRAQEGPNDGLSIGLIARVATPGLRRLHVYLSRDAEARDLFREQLIATDRDNPAVMRRGWRLARLLWPHGLEAIHRAEKELRNATKAT